MNGKTVIKFLQKEGWKILRSQGSHYRLGKGLLAAIERQTGVKLS